MSSRKYNAYAALKDTADFNSLAQIKLDSFEVVGGAYRSIDLATTNEMSIASEMEQARIYKNINFYKLPSDDFTDFKLMEMFRAKQAFTLYFIINTYIGKKMMESITLRAENALISSYPMIIGYAPKMLLVPVSIPNATINHSVSKDGKHFTYDDW